jgi:ATP-dependent RNA helicase MSS116
MNATKFAELPISSRVQLAMSDIFRYTDLSEVQAATFPYSLIGNGGHDVFAKAKTGSGKTISFLLPIIDRLAREKLVPIGGPIRALVISPSRELADQSRREAAKLLTYLPFGVQVVIGGEDMKKQKNALTNKPCDILLATPGRLQDLINNFSGFAARLKGVQVLVLDECDRLLDGGFRPNIMYISSFLPGRDKDMQTLLFTATVPKGVMEIAVNIMRPTAKYIDVSGDDAPGASASVARIKQEVLCIPAVRMLPALFHVICNKMKERSDYRIIVFFINIGITKFMSALFRAAGVSVLEMHSDLSQSQRSKTAQSFYSKSGQVMFASDVIARGIDFPDVTLVIQFGSTDISQYEHRVGRTGRAGKSGEALLIVSHQEEQLVKHLVNAHMPIKEAESTSIITHGLTSVSASSSVLSPSSSSFPTELTLAIKSVEGESSLKKMAQSAFKALLGSYAAKRGLLKLKRDGIFELVTAFCLSAGLSKVPDIKPETLKKMGLGL